MAHFHRVRCLQLRRLSHTLSEALLTQLPSMFSSGGPLPKTLQAHPILSFWHVQSVPTAHSPGDILHSHDLSLPLVTNPRDLTGAQMIRNSTFQAPSSVSLNAGMFYFKSNPEGIEGRDCSSNSQPPAKFLEWLVCTGRKGSRPHLCGPFIYKNCYKLSNLGFTSLFFRSSLRRGQ